MTPQSIEVAVTMAFHALYPTANIVVHSAGSETIIVAVQHKTDYIQGFTADIDSDDDGYFHFHLDDTTVTILVPYPEDLDERTAREYGDDPMGDYMGRNV